MKRLYLETRLFNIHDRKASLALCEEVDRWIDSGELKQMEHCFLPYRDSNGALPDKVADFGRAIFDLDEAVLRASCGVIGYFDGPFYDSGCGFEIGLAYALGYPVNLITTDSYLCSVGDSVEMYPISKLVQYVAQVVHVFAPDPSIADYRTACEDLLQRALRQLKQNLIEEYGTRWSPRTALQAGEVEYDYYLDPNFKYTESGRKLLSAIRVILEDAGKTCTLGDNQGSIAEDISRLTKSGRAILLFDRVDTNVDSAVLNGIAYGIGRKPILYCSTEQTYKNGPAPNRLNIMNEYSSAAVARSLKELERVIRQNS